MPVALVLYDITRMLRNMLPLPMLFMYFPILKVFPLIFLVILYKISMYYYFPTFSSLFLLNSALQALADLEFLLCLEIT